MDIESSSTFSEGSPPTRYIVSNKRRIVRTLILTLLFSLFWIVAAEQYLFKGWLFTATSLSDFEMFKHSVAQWIVKALMLFYYPVYSSLPPPIRNGGFGPEILMDSYLKLYLAAYVLYTAVASFLIVVFVEFVIRRARRSLVVIGTALALLGTLPANAFAANSSPLSWWYVSLRYRYPGPGFALSDLTKIVKEDLQATGVIFYTPDSIGNFFVAYRDKELGRNRLQRLKILTGAFYRELIEKNDLVNIGTSEWWMADECYKCIKSPELAECKIDRMRVLREIYGAVEQHKISSSIDRDSLLVRIPNPRESLERIAALNMDYPVLFLRPVHPQYAPTAIKESAQRLQNSPRK